MTAPEGPIYIGTAIPISINDGKSVYDLVYYPDRNNAQLQLEGQPPHYYYMPRDVRISRDPNTGDYKFHLLHFEGVRSGDTNVGVVGTNEIAGGVLSVTVTSGIPADVLKAAHDQFSNQFKGSGDPWWGWRNPAPPQFGPVPIRANMTSISNLSPNAGGMVPTVGPAAAGGPAPAGGANAGKNVASRNAPPPIISKRRPLMVPSRRTVSSMVSFRDSPNLDMWYFNMQGQGPGAIDLQAENAYSGLVGSIPAAILWSSFHDAYSSISVSQALSMPMWAPSGSLHIHGSWDRIFNHFSAAASVGYFWFSGDIQVEFNNMRINGDIQVELDIDPTLPNSDKIQEMLLKTSDLVYNTFMDEAKKVIFDPAPPDVKPAQASGGGGFFGLGGSFSLKERRDETQVNLSYDEVLNTRFLQNDVISSTLEGFYNEIKADPTAEKKYFSTVYLGDWERKISHIIKPVVNWQDTSKKWIGEPVAFLSVQVGYPNTSGDLEWVAHVFQPSDGVDPTWGPQLEMKNASDVSTPPDGWTPDKSFVKRQVHFTEPPDETAFPYAHVFVEQDVADLDPGDTGTLTNDLTLEVRADSAGKLDVGPIRLNVDLDSPKQIVSVAFQAYGQDVNGNDRTVTNFEWTSADQTQDRYWAIYTGQKDFVPRYKYQVTVTVKGSIFSKGMSWTGPWVDVVGNGPVMVQVPTPDQAVSSRSLIPGVKPSVVPAPAPIGGKYGPPPPTSSRKVPAAVPPAAAVPAGNVAEGRGYVGAGRGAPPTTGGGAKAAAPVVATRAAPATPDTLTTGSNRVAGYDVIH